MCPIHHSYVLRSSRTVLTALWKAYFHRAATQLFRQSPTQHSSNIFFWGFHLSADTACFCPVKALQNLRRGLCCLLVGENLITGHGGVRAPRLLAPASSPTMAGGPEAPVRLVHGDIFTGLLTVWASQLTLLQLTSPCGVCSTAGQEKTGFGSCLSDQPLGLLVLSHLYAAHISSA